MDLDAEIVEVYRALSRDLYSSIERLEGDKILQPINLIEALIPVASLSP